MLVTNILPSTRKVHTAGTSVDDANKNIEPGAQDSASLPAPYSRLSAANTNASPAFDCLREQTLESADCWQMGLSPSTRLSAAACSPNLPARGAVRRCCTGCGARKRGAALGAERGSWMTGSPFPQSHQFLWPRTRHQLETVGRSLSSPGIHQHLEPAPGEDSTSQRV